ncbi:hypothetical protein D3C83_22730 [compost metagenome]
MQDGNRAGWQFVKRTDHALEIDAVRGRVVIGIAIDRISRVFEKRAVILPTRIADPELGAGIDPAQQVGAQFKPPGTAQGLDRHDAACTHRRAVRAEYQPLDRTIIGLQAIDRQVIAGQRTCGEFLLGASD